MNVPFSWRISLFVVSALLLALLGQFLLGFWLFGRAFNNDLRRDLERYSFLIEQDLVQGEQEVSLTPDSLTLVADFSAYANARARVLDPANKPVLLLGGRYPDDSSGWLLQRRALPEGFVLETAMSTDAHNVALQDYLRASLLILPVVILLFGGAGLLLSVRLLKPLRDLQDTVANVTDTNDLQARVEVGEVRDELSDLARNYNRMMAKLERSFERERTFTRYAAHELRTPLTALRVLVDAALEGSIPARTTLPNLKRELARLSSIQESLLILAKDQLRPDQEVDLTSVVYEAVDRARLAAADQPHLIEAEVQEHVRIQGNEALLGRLLDNLLENAVKYSAAGAVTVYLEEESGARCLKVRDEGSGVAPQHVVKLATPFYRASTAPGGVGLGLAVVKHIAHAHRANLSFQNCQPLGFEVSVQFPKLPVKEEGPHSVTSRAAAES